MVTGALTWLSVPIRHDETLHKQRDRNSIRPPGELRRIATRYDRSAHIFFTAITLPAIVTL